MIIIIYQIYITSTVITFHIGNKQGKFTERNPFVFKLMNLSEEEFKMYCVLIWNR